MTYYATYDDYKLLWIWKQKTFKNVDTIHYKLVVKIYNTSELGRLVITKTHLNLDKLRLYYKNAAFGVKTNLKYKLEWDFATILVGGDIKKYLFKRKLNTQNVEKFLFAELI